jgi:hypothetical protein
MDSLTVRLVARVAALEAENERMVRLAAGMAAWLWAIGVRPSEREVVHAVPATNYNQAAIEAVRAWLAQHASEGEAKGGEGCL